MKKRSITGNVEKSWEFVSGGKSEEGDSEKLESTQGEVVNHEQIKMVKKALDELDSETSKIDAENAILSKEIAEMKREKMMLEVFNRKSKKLADKCKMFKEVISGSDNKFIWEEEEEEFDWETEIEKLKKELSLMI